MTVFVVEYGRGNIFSITQALTHLGATFTVSDNPSLLKKASHIIFPGVGAFGDAMSELESRGLTDPMKDIVRSGTPVLGICVGCQLLLDSGEEFGEFEGLGLISGKVKRLPPRQNGDTSATRIPNVGWRKLQIRSTPVANRIEMQNEYMYFTHSFAPFIDNVDNILATIPVNGIEIPIAYQNKNIIGVQFHPEKSGPAGLKFISEFLKTKQ